MGWSVLIGTTGLLVWHCLDSFTEAIPSAQHQPALETWDPSQTHSHSLPMDHPSTYLSNTETLSPAWSWYIGHRARNMYTPVLGWNKYRVLSIKERTASASLHIFSGAGSLNIPENSCMPTSVSYFFVGPYTGHFPMISLVIVLLYPHFTLCEGSFPLNTAFLLVDFYLCHDCLTTVPW